jgi:hypothetical protein
MAETSAPWGVDATDAGSADARLYQDGWRALVGGNFPDAVILDRSNATPANAPLYVSAPGTGTVISVSAGQAVVQGSWYQNTTTKTFDLAALGTQPTTGQSRTDRVILRYNPTATPASSRITMQLLTGTPATTGSQVAPNLTQNVSGTWEIELARVTRVAASNVAQAAITNNQPHPVVGVRSPIAPGNPVVGQQWVQADGSTWIWSGTAWKYNGGGATPTLTGRVLTTSAATATPTGATSLPNYVFDTAPQPTVLSARSTSNRFYAETAGTFRLRSMIQIRSLAAANSLNQLTVTLNARLNAADSATGGTSIWQTMVTLEPGLVSASSYALAELDEPTVAMNAGDYVQFFMTWLASNSGSTNISAQVIGNQTLSNMTWVGP